MNMVMLKLQHENATLSDVQQMLDSAINMDKLCSKAFTIYGNLLIREGKLEEAEKKLKEGNNNLSSKTTLTENDIELFAFYATFALEHLKKEQLAGIYRLYMRFHFFFS